MTGLQIQDRTGRTDILFYLVIQIAVMFLTDGMNTGNTDTFTRGHTAGKFQCIRAGVIAKDNQLTVLQPDMNFHTWFFFSGLQAPMQGIFKQVSQKGDQVDFPHL